MAEQEKFLIVGAGLGGLVLAQILRSRKVPFEIFERDVTPDARQQGWAVSLKDCLADLAELMPADLKDMGELESISVNYGTGKLDYMTILEETTGKTLVTMGGVPYGTPGHVLRASRGKARNYFWQHLPVQTGKHFTHYVADAAGVTAHFKDGSSARGAVLVGADGAHSPIRSQLIGDPKPTVPSRWVPIIGEAELPRSVYERLWNTGTAGVLTVSDTFRYMAGTCAVSPDGDTARLFYSTSYSTDDPAGQAEWVRSADAPTLYAKALELSKNMPDWLVEPIRHGGEKSMVTPPVALIEYVSPPSLPAGRVTLLGDAAHTMIPFRGMGANCAVRDACELGRALAERHDAAVDRASSGEAAAAGVQEPIEELLRRYEEVILARGHEIVLSSRAAGEPGAGKTTGDPVSK